MCSSTLQHASKNKTIFESILVHAHPVRFPVCKLEYYNMDWVRVLKYWFCVEVWLLHASRGESVGVLCVVGLQTRFWVCCRLFLQELHFSSLFANTNYSKYRRTRFPCDRLEKRSRILWRGYLTSGSPNVVATKTVAEFTYNHTKRISTTPMGSVG